MKLTRVKNNLKPNQLRIEYMLGNLCNHKCSYCFPGSNEGTHPWPDIEQVKTNLSHLLNHYVKQGKDYFQLYLIGGEPTLWKELPEFCRYFKQHFNCQINISTNGSRSVSWWERNADCFDVVEISVHHEFAKVEHLKKVSDLIYKKNIYVNCNVLMDYGYFDKCKAIVEQLKTSKKRWPIIAKTVQINGATFYNPEEAKYLEKSLKRIPNLLWYWRNKVDTELELELTFENEMKMKVTGDNYIAVHNLNKFEGWTCELGLDVIKIFQEGNIKSNCQQTLYRLNRDYNLYDKDFVKDFNPRLCNVICEQKICACSGEISINKIAP